MNLQSLLKLLFGFWFERPEKGKKKSSLIFFNFYILKDWPLNTAQMSVGKKIKHKTKRDMMRGITTVLINVTSTVEAIWSEKKNTIT